MNEESTFRKNNSESKNHKQIGRHVKIKTKNVAAKELLGLQWGKIRSFTCQAHQQNKLHV